MMDGEKTNDQDMGPRFKEITWHKFLIDTPPGKWYLINEMVEKPSPGGQYQMLTPDISLYCDNQSCQGERLFEYLGEGHTFRIRSFKKTFIEYRCKNCEENIKRYAMFFFIDNDGKSLSVKIGEWPPFGPYVPPRVIKLIGPDRELFLQGRRAENQGMGIGAYAYYRRVVENQWGRMMQNIISAGERLKIPEENIEQLRTAMEERKFSKSLEIMKPAIPEEIRIKGHNPLALLHDSLSVGIHRKDDTECLELAADIRVVLTELANRIGQALKDQSELDSALSRILKQDKAREDPSHNGKES